MSEHGFPICCGAAGFFQFYPADSFNLKRNFAGTFRVGVPVGFFFIRFSGPIHRVPDVLHAFHMVILMFRRMGSCGLSLILAIGVSWDRDFFLPFLAWNLSSTSYWAQRWVPTFSGQRHPLLNFNKVTYKESISIFWGIFTGSLYVYW